MNSPVKAIGVWISEGFLTKTFEDQQGKRTIMSIYYNKNFSWTRVSLARAIFAPGKADVRRMLVAEAGRVATSIAYAQADIGGKAQAVRQPIQVTRSRSASASCEEKGTHPKPQKRNRNPKREESAPHINPFMHLRVNSGVQIPL